jgi:small neutral amino acid transporter SnatA (MarC family)
MATISSEYNKDKRSIIAFFIATLATVLSTDLIKCFIANRIKQKLNPKIMTIINHVVGVLLALFGIVIILRVSIN